MSDKVEITWRGHSCFEIRLNQETVVIDPFLEVPGYGLLDLQADLVLVSHEHDDHNARQRVRLTGREPVAGVEVIESFHDSRGGRLRGPNKIHIVTMAGRRIAHLGDLGHDLNQSQLGRLSKLDVIMIPVGGHYTIDADQAAALVKAVEPVITVPMHYREGKAGWDVTSGVQPFLDHFDQVTFLDQSSFFIDEVEGGVLVLKNPIVKGS
ncbi:MAG TPA: MBL fold metallo-hydrolase [Bacillota bacterium]|jgi:L-ascorbate metabolism protein UlaG (beta-lactamase superfamily)|nr:MBL fold metallo-hydrolase [Fastidiosipila sp.]HPX92672.1 MBL fold metallo-hydrolase [Bacillota bacterium]HQB81039.1 MBL fold metallo-hydrolase [Bacillota bacterium]